MLDLGDAGGAVTEFLRLTTGAPGTRVLRRELGPPHPSIPVGLQVMAPGPEWVAETAARAGEAGASFLDLNFGCPVKRVFNRCAGSALLAHPDRLRAIVAAAVSGAAIPVTAKIRAGIEDDGRLEEVLDAAASGGAAAILLHARLRVDSYAAPARWERIARASAFLRARHPGVALVGNGGVERAADARRMREETGCDAVLLGRAAFSDPFLFREIRGGPPASLAEAAAFALRYLDAFLLPPGTVRAGTGKAKQFVRCYRAGGIFEGREGERARLLSEAGPAAIRAWFAARAAEAGPGAAPVAEEAPRA
ncbi:MAG: tRNA-dihydrouridine synthase family protein [Planctomycetes bacterium]|nr:tRNA-dihydrouridine synthase family protein [Planctomycetota bacterium]